VELLIEFLGGVFLRTHSGITTPPTGTFFPTALYLFECQNAHLTPTC